MKATQAGIVILGGRAGAVRVTGESGATALLADPALQRHNSNVHQLLAHGRQPAAPAPLQPDGQEIIGLVAAVYGLSAARAADRLAAIDFVAARARATA